MTHSLAHSREMTLWRSNWAYVAVPLAIMAAAFFLPGPLVHLPDWAVLPLSDYVGRGLNWFARDAAIGEVKIADATRALAAIAETPILWLKMLLVDGWVKGAGFNKVHIAPPLSWVGVILVTALVALRISGRSLAILTLAAGAYLVVFGLWVSAMITLASVLLCVVTGLALGLAMGIWAYRSPGAEAGLRAVMNIMQTVPIFSYLLPTLLLFGYGPSAALFATVVYALPPMVHATVLALRSVPSETLELARMTGCSRRQTLWKVELPVAMPQLAIGLNQVVMMTLNMVIIASMIGAGGLGYDVLRALRRLDFGAGFEAGMGIVALAVVLDRLTQAAARNQSTGRHRLWRRRDTVVALSLLAVPTVVSLAVPALAAWPAGWTLTTAPFWNAAVSFINQTFYGPLEAVRTAMLLGVMNPFRDLLQSAPWSVVVLLLAVAAYALGGLRTAALVVLLILFIVVTGYWQAAMSSVYLTVLSVAIALAIGLPLGIWVAGHPRLHGPVQLALDTLQTLPTLVYLLPAVMLFRNGDFSALIAIASYAIAPAVRYGMAGMAHVPHERIEAGLMSGCTPWQTFRFISLPSALPTLILGVNQTVMMALSMLVIAALVGTRELGQEVYTALARGQTGPGIVAGLCVACIALIADALLKSGAARAAGREGDIHV
ncbi:MULTISPECIES: ABC transporter permease [Rhizobium]|uniref:ABC transporter permease n=1 Tax=Rhizobium TaxID=379 RepID=UPI0007EC2BD3|nr:MULTISPECIES: ABC transporter permease subunit [Rhizobium]ANK91612.1 ABC transporter permease protein [Rhizobium sp. N6212]ANK97646.1 ABC transporter permease protein [Rhizobium sp. N621]ANL03725.1 ABC transporter permease protein [Rhizobium esperanzae]ANL09771.1 ABC transporter permease protein [Rhizobium sp. N1341]ANL21823.1 ABC transporter permease protein [Rhizobium sp. N113]